MKNFLRLFLISIVLSITLNSCNKSVKETESGEGDFKYLVDQFKDIRVLRYRVPGFDQLTQQQKKFIYYLSEAALDGRDILWAQNFKYNLPVRKTVEAIINNYDGDKESDDYKGFIVYAKRIFFANGIHHHYSNDKFKPDFSREFFESQIRQCDPETLPLRKGEKVDDFISFLSPIIFDETLYPRKIEQKQGVDIITSSSTNMYEGVTQKEVEDYYASKMDPSDPHPVSIGLNSRLIMKDGKIIEEVYKAGGLYGQAIESIIVNLEKASMFAETDTQKKELGILIDYYKTGNLRTWDDYNVIWAKDTEPEVDYINGFIETYGDPLGMKATWEAIVDYKDIEATKRTEIISENAQWFEDHSPIQPEYRKAKVTGVAAKVINIAMLGGDCYPASPIGINLPNADWIRKEVGSKSVTLANITDAYDMASQGSGFLEEFAANEEEIERARLYGNMASTLMTDLHECVGHASGKLAEGTDPNALKNYSSALEEARADLFALYFLMDQKIIDLKLLPNSEAAEAEYDSYMRNGLMTQLVRIKPGKQIEEAHMRDRALIAHWAFDKGQAENVVEMFKKDGKTYVRINDYQKLRDLFGQLLKEIQRIKSEGDFEAGKKLIEDYGVKVDETLHSELLDRYTNLKLAPYSGFINPVMKPVVNADGEITDIKIEYVDDYLSQMMYYGRNYSFLPAYN
jgi:dipeptidyl-peptidase-3